MHPVDRLGRRRRATQTRGLRPLYPELPAGHRSRLVRIAMSNETWGRLERALASSPAATAPRALGDLIERLLPEVAPVARPTWQDWQMRKELGLLSAAGRRGICIPA